MKTSLSNRVSWPKLSWRFWALALPLLGILLGFFIVAVGHNGQLSRKDFTAIEEEMNSVYKAMKLSDVDTARVCYEYKDGMGETLKCQVEMAAYIPLNNPNQIQTIAKNYDSQLASISQTTNILHPPNRATGATIMTGAFMAKDVKSPMGCSATMVARGSDLRLGRGLPRQDLTNKLALVLACGGQSREAYFKMQ